MVSPAATPSGYGSFSSTTKCRRIGTESSTPSQPADVSHRNDCNGVSVNRKPSVGSMRSKSNAAMITHRNAVWPAAVPADWMTLFSHRLKSRKMSPSERKPRNAATTEMFGPNPSLSTMYGYEAPITAEMTSDASTARGVNSRRGEGSAAGDGAGTVAAMGAQASKPDHVMTSVPRWSPRAPRGKLGHGTGHEAGLHICVPPCDAFADTCVSKDPFVRTGL